jgi:hypothetical protein
VTATGTSSPGEKHNAGIIGGAIGGSLGTLAVAVVILCCWRYRRLRCGRNLDGHVKNQLRGRAPCEMQGQITQPTELPSRNSTIGDSHKTVTPSMLYERKVLSPTRSSPPASTGSPAESMPSHSPRSLSANTFPPPLFNTRLGSPFYQHPAHQSPGRQDLFPPPPAGRSDALSRFMLAQPQTAHGRSHELPASTSPAVAAKQVGEMSADTIKSPSRSTDSLA